MDCKLTTKSEMKKTKEKGKRRGEKKFAVMLANPED